LAIAINHDSAPIREALRAVDWNHEQEADLPVVAKPDLPPDGWPDIAADTQVPIFRNGAVLGFLDLVLRVHDDRQAKFEIWIEVKAFAPQSGIQLATYREHAANCTPQPVLVTLGVSRVSPYVPALKWTDIVGAIEAVPNPHHSWISLREFLFGERIVRRALPTQVVDPAPFVDVITGANSRLARLWPEPALGLIWIDGALRNALEKSFREHRELLTTAGPIEYGLAIGDEGPAWRMVVTTRRNYHSIRLDPSQVLAAAEAGGLSTGWGRHSSGQEVLTRTAPLETLASHDEAVAWFDLGFQQLRNARVLDTYLTGLAEKRSKQAIKTESQQAP
jgi:hypothetical protein